MRSGRIRARRGLRRCRRPGMILCLSAVWSFLLTISSVSAKYWRRSEWPMRVWVAPMAEKLANGGFARVGAFLGEVHVLAADGDVGTGIACGDDRWQQHRRREQSAISSRVWPATRGRKASTKALASAGVLYIFQLAAMSAVRAIVMWVSSEFNSSGMELVRRGDGGHNGEMCQRRCCAFRAKRVLRCN
jgi:hypothetical protein